jgi:hypothetical protein
MLSQCVYGSTDCTCFNGSWHCAMCPATQPADNSSCNNTGLLCQFSGVSCACFGGGWHCTTACPAQQPAPGTMCTGGGMQQCSYGTTTCVCIQGQYFCN